MLDISEVLREMGYHNLLDCGNAWRTTSIYRNGSNPTSLFIYKNGGNWLDFGNDTKGSFDDLIKATLGEADYKDFLKIHGIKEGQFKEEAEITKPKLRSPKFFSIDTVNELMPHYKFYTKKGISEKTLRFFRSGLAHGDEMNLRYVFPIFDFNGRVQGLSGRDVIDKRWQEKGLKWKHLGPKTEWIYPVFVKGGADDNFVCYEEIRKKKSVILVESIGDMLKLWDHGVKNVVVTFGVSASSKLCSFLMAQPLDEIIIATNNDFHKKDNTGSQAAYKIFIKLANYVGVDKIKIILPHTNDFGDMTFEDLNKWERAKGDYDPLHWYKLVVKFIEGLDAKRKTKHVLKLQENLNEKILFESV